MIDSSAPDWVRGCMSGKFATGQPLNDVTGAGWLHVWPLFFNSGRKWEQSPSFIPFTLLTNQGLTIWLTDKYLFSLTYHYVICK